MKAYSLHNVDDLRYEDIPMPECKPGWVIVQVKAAGGIRSWEAAKTMIEAGATRLGTSSGVKIIEEMKEAGLE